MTKEIQLNKKIPIFKLIKSQELNQVLVKLTRRFLIRMIKTKMSIKKRPVKNKQIKWNKQEIQVSDHHLNCLTKQATINREIQKIKSKLNQMERQNPQVKKAL